MTNFSYGGNTVHYTLDDFDSELKFGQLGGDEYARIRLNVYRDRYEEVADRLNWMLLFYKIATYAIGAVSSFLSYMGLEVSESTLLQAPPFALTSSFALTILNSNTSCTD